MSAYFRIAQRYNLSKIASQYMSRPPPPSSVSQFSKVDREVLQSRASARFGGEDPANDKGGTGLIEKHIQVMKSRTGNAISWPIKRLQTAENQKVEEDTPLRNSLFKEIREFEVLEEGGLYSPDEAVPASTQRNILIACMFSLFVSQSLFLSVETIIPVYVDEKYNNSINQNGDPIIKLNTTQVSLIMIALEILSFIVSPIVPMLSQKYGRKNVILFGYLIVVFSTCALSFTYLIKDPTVYMWTAIACRLMQGAGDQ